MVSSQSMSNQSKGNNESIFFKANIDRERDVGDSSKEETKHYSSTVGAKGGQTKKSMTLGAEVMDKKRTMQI